MTRIRWPAGLSAPLLAALLALALLGAGCLPPDRTEFSTPVPNAETVTLKVQGMT
jgi:hypothetical protein